MDKGLDKIWAPWREQYVTKDIKSTKGCVFCRILKSKKDKENFILIRTKLSYAVLNIYPYNNGHTLILPNRHVRDIKFLKKEEHDDMFELLDVVRELLDEVLQPQGYNIGINLGRVAGAGFPKHVHIHVVPRWKGDVNFMPVTGATKVISQSLQSVHKQLINAYKRRSRKTRS